MTPHESCPQAIGESIPIATLHGVSFERLLFAATLACLAVFRRRTFLGVLAGLAAIVIWKIFVAGFDGGTGLAGLSAHLTRGANMPSLALLLTGYDILASHFEQSRLPDIASKYAPHGRLRVLFSPEECACARSIAGSLTRSAQFSISREA